MKKITCGIFMAMGFSSAFAAVDFYVGAGAGLNQFTAKRNIIVADAITPSDKNVINQHNVGNGLIGNVFFGVRYFINPFSLSGEIDGQLSNAEITGSDSSYLLLGFPTGMKIKKNGSIRLSVLPGFNLTDKTSVFARLGYARTRFSFASTDSSGGEFIPNGEVKETLSAYVLGMGMDTEVTDSVRARFEYNYSRYQETNLPASGTTAGNFIVSGSIRPIDHQVAVSFIVKLPV